MTLPIAAARPCFGLALALVLSAGLPSPVLAAGRSPQIEKARQLIEDAEFDQALKVINEGLTAPDNSDAVLVSLYELQGIAYLYQGKEDRARQAFEKLLQASPEHELAKGTSSKIRTLYEQVRNDAKTSKLKPVKISHERLTSAKAGERLDVRAQISDLPQTAKARLYYRRSGTESFSSTSFGPDKGTEYVAKVPAFELPEESTDWALEYYLEVDASGRRLAGVGDALAPLSLRVLAAASPEDPVQPGPAVEAAEPWYKKWWVWTIVGVVAVGAGAGATAAVLSTSNSAQVPVTIKVQQ